MAISPEPPKIPVGTSGRRRWRWLGRLVAGLAVLAVLLAVVLVVPRLLYPPLTNRELDRQGVTDGKERIELKREQDKLQNDARGALLQGLGGAVLLLGAYFTWRQLSVTREGQLTERFTRAVDQLGSDHVDVRLGGIYALERIARDSDIDRATIGEVLTAYVRGHAPLAARPEGAAARRHAGRRCPLAPAAGPGRAGGCHGARPRRLRRCHGDAAARPVSGRSSQGRSSQGRSFQRAASTSEPLWRTPF
jgi:hypothetical protein